MNELVVTSNKLNNFPDLSQVASGRMWPASRQFYHASVRYEVLSSVTY
jgi:hypothetical protein